jgi:DNA-binding transcriptional ArsR family regulator
MEEQERLAALAAQLGDRSRAAMVVSLMDGSSRPGSELALLANLSAPSASMHLSKLVHGGVLTVRSEGRNKYYRIATPAMAHAIEALGVASNVGIHVARRRVIANPWAFARTCYDHLAGKLGVALAFALQRRRYLKVEGRDFELTPAGEVWLEEFGVDWRALKSMKRSFAPQCLDWTERRYHVAGALGSALLIRMFERGWLKKAWLPRLVRVTTKGERELKEALSVVVSPQIGERHPRKN